MWWKSDALPEVPAHTKLPSPSSGTPPRENRPGCGATRARLLNGWSAWGCRHRDSTGRRTTNGCRTASTPVQSSSSTESATPNSSVTSASSGRCGGVGNRLLQPDPRNSAQHVGPRNLGAPHRRLSTGDGRTLRDAPRPWRLRTPVSALGPRVRLRYGGGGFFSVGSIAWTGSLSHNDYDNNVARLTTNVLRRFRDPEPLK